MICAKCGMEMQGDREIELSYDEGGDMEDVYSFDPMIEEEEDENCGT